MKFYKIVYSPDVEELITELESNVCLNSDFFVFKILNKYEVLLDITHAINIKILLAIYRANLELKKIGIKLYYPVSFSVNFLSDLFYKFPDSPKNNKKYNSIFDE